MILSKKLKPASTQFEGEVYVIVDGNTQSSASQFAAIMQIQSLAVIVGEERGSMYNTTNTSAYSDFQLPASKILIRLPDAEYLKELDNKVTPDLIYHHSARSIVEQKDKVLESVIQYIKTKP